MPNFGEFETVGEPVAITREAGHTTYIWQAHRGQDDHDYAIKCYAPRPRRKESASPGDTLGIDRGLEFVGGVKQLEQVRAAGGRCLARIYAVGKTADMPDLGLTAEGAWYATDFCKGKTLKEWVQIRGRVDGATLRNVVTAVITGCLALQRSRGFGHGNIKPSNILLTGPTRPLRSRPLLLIDPYPSAPSQLDRLEPRDRQEVSELLKEVVEARDLRGLGELILQLVEGRLVGAGFDYDYPIQASSASSPWKKLGKEKQEWLDLCNQLLDPQLKLDKVNFEILSRNPKLKQTEWGPVVVKAGIGVAAVVVLGGLAWGSWSLLKTFQNQGKKRHEQLVKQWDDLSANGRLELENTNFQQAVSSFAQLNQIARKLEDSSKAADATRLEQLAQCLQTSKQERDKPEPDYISLLQNLELAGTHLNEDTNTSYARWRAGVRDDALKQAINRCGTLLQNAYAMLDATNIPLAQIQSEFTDARNYAQRLKEFRAGDEFLTNSSEGLELVAKLDSAVKALNTTNLGTAETHATDVLTQRKNNRRAEYVIERVDAARSIVTKNLGGYLNQIYDKWGGSNNVPPKLTQLATSEFNGTIPVTDYFPPPIWSKMDPSYKTTELAALEKALASDPSRKGLEGWSKRVEEDYKSIGLAQVASDWPPNLGLLKSDIEQLKGRSDVVDPAALANLTSTYSNLEIELTAVSSNAARGGFPKTFHQTASRNALTDYRALSSSIAVQKSNLAGAMKKTELTRAQTEYKKGLETGDFSTVKSICSTYPDDTAFKALGEKARDQEAQFTQTVDRFQKALTNGDYSVVFTNGLFASNVTVKALSKQAHDETNRLEEARLLLQNCGYPQAREKLKDFSKDNRVAAGIGANIDQEQGYLNKLGDFVRTNAYQEATAYFEKDVPANVRGKPCFSQIYEQAKNGVQKEQKYTAAKTAFGSGLYADALVLCNQNTTEPRFAQLKRDALNENSVLTNASSKLDAGEYNELETALQSLTFTNKQPFIDLVKKNRDESRTLDQLKSLETPANWTTLNSQMTSLQKSQPAIWRKQPFQEIDGWLKKNDQVGPLDQKLALYEVWFGVDKNSGGRITDPQTGKPAKPRSSATPSDRDLVTTLWNNFDSLHSLNDDRKNRLNKIKANISRLTGG